MSGPSEVPIQLQLAGAVAFLLAGFLDQLIEYVLAFHKRSDVVFRYRDWIPEDVLLLQGVVGGAKEIAILARLLGIHIKVAVAWQHASAGDWMSYAADISHRLES